jgi:membrane protease YdiL (CAAX protease family)
LYAHPFQVIFTAAMPGPETPSLLRVLHVPRRLFVELFLESWRAIDEEAERERAPGVFDPRPLVVLCAAAALLALMWSFGRRPGYEAFLEWRVALDGAGSFWDEVQRGPYADLAYRFWWAGWRVLGYLLLPLALVRFGLRGRLRDYGLEARGLREDAPLYAAAFAVVLAFVIAVSFSDAFVQKYPFYAEAGRSVHDLLLWELAYAAQFVSLEFFYRGFLLNALRPSMGSHAIFVMTVPYCMVHFGKPLGETIGAIFAGIFLGTLALRSRSIWGGFFLHVGVAVSMDLASLVQTGRIPTTW